MAIAIEGTTKGTITNAQGQFQINTESGEVLVFSSVGFQTIKIVVDGQTPLNITMQESLGSLGDVVVTALGIERQTQDLEI